MQSWEIEKLTYRVCSGFHFVNVDGTSYKFGPVSAETKYEAMCIYDEVMQESVLYGLLTQEEAIKQLIRIGVWSVEDEERLTKAYKDIEDFKVGLFENFEEPGACDRILELIHQCNSSITEMENRKNSLSYITDVGVANSAKMRYISGISLLQSDGTKYWKSKEDYRKPDFVLEECMENLFTSRMSETQARTIIKNEPWRSIWSSRKYCDGIFGRTSLDITEDQRSLILWSSIYDSIREHSEPPSEAMFEVDEAIDGWLISQRKNKGKEGILKKVGSKVANSDEVYIVANKLDEVAEIHNLNDKMGKHIIAQRNAVINEKGKVNDLELPDVWQRFTMECAQANTKAILDRK